MSSETTPSVKHQAATGIEAYDSDEAFERAEPWPTQNLEILSDAVSHRGTIIYRDPSRQLSLGVWECQPGKFRFLEDGVAIETCVMGKATITDESTGKSVTVTPGMSWFVKPGTMEIWEVLEPFRKEYIILDEYVDDDRYW